MLNHAPSACRCPRAQQSGERTRKLSRVLACLLPCNLATCYRASATGQHFIQPSSPPLGLPLCASIMLPCYRLTPSTLLPIPWQVHSCAAPSPAGGGCGHGHAAAKASPSSRTRALSSCRRTATSLPLQQVGPGAIGLFFQALRNGHLHRLIVHRPRSIFGTLQEALCQRPPRRRRRQRLRRHLQAGCLAALSAAVQGLGSHPAPHRPCSRLAVGHHSHKPSHFCGGLIQSL